MRSPKEFLMKHRLLAVLVALGPVFLMIGVWPDAAPESPVLESVVPVPKAIASAATATTTPFQSDEIAALRRELEQIRTAQRSSPVAAPSEPAVAAYAGIIRAWQDRVAKVGCDWSTGEGKYGSATIVNLEGYGLTAVTNAHVAIDDAGYAPSSCGIGVYGIGGRIIDYDPEIGQFFSFEHEGLDLAYIRLDDESYETDAGLLDSVAYDIMPVCSDADVSMGDEIVILGYPGNGSQGSVTATRGIISGFEYESYVTDAKIDHGNSGGAAVLVKKSCWLGIPSSVVVNTESFGRVLKGTYVLAPT